MTTDPSLVTCGKEANSAELKIIAELPRQWPRSAKELIAEFRVKGETLEDELRRTAERAQQYKTALVVIQDVVNEVLRRG